MWGLDTVRVIVAAELPRQAHNAPLHLFSASPELVGFGRSIFRRRSAETSMVLDQLLAKFGKEGWMYTMEDFKRDYIKENFARLTPQEQQEALEKLPPEQRLVGLSAEQVLASVPEEQIRQYLDQLAASQPTGRSKRRRKR